MQKVTAAGKVAKSAHPGTPHASDIIQLALIRSPF